VFDVFDVFDDCILMIVFDVWVAVFGGCLVCFVSSLICSV